MRLLMIATGYLPHTFSENLCNAKLAYAMYEKGWTVDVVSRTDAGPAYSVEWTEPWLPLKENALSIEYGRGNAVERACDIAFSSLSMKTFPDGGIRWARRAYDTAEALCRKNRYDAVLTRSPNDTAHLVGLRLKEKHGLRWIANWNDPASPIWPEPYKHHFSRMEQSRKMRFTEMCLRGADVNTFPSRSLLNHFLEFFPFLSETDTAVIPHIALPESIFPKADGVRSGDTFRMCHSGNMSEERNPELTFKAMRELIDEQPDDGKHKIHLSIMGHINDYTDALIEKYSLRDYVDCIGSFPYLEAVRKMQDFDCLVLLEAKLEKGIFFASKFTDYAQAGRPILAISPKSGFAADTLAEYGGGIAVDNEDCGSIKKGIKSLYEAWLSGRLSETYPTDTLYEQMSAPRVLRIYEDLMSRLKIP